MTGSFHTIHTHDQLSLERLKRAPESGPSVLFFSGGTALRETSRQIIRYTHNSVHLITPFDSGGSSAVLRRAFAMPAVGDIRNRLMALADQREPGNKGIYALFTYRFSKRAGQDELRAELARMARGEHFLIHCIPGIKGGVVMDHLQRFMEIMPHDFDLRGASVGNLVLTAGYMQVGRELAPVIESFSELARVRGMVRPVVDTDQHLAAELEDGTHVVGQHVMTGKEAEPLAAPIKDMWLTDSPDSEIPVFPAIIDAVADLISGADLICFPPGSLYSSVLANLLPGGVGRAVAENPCPKVYVPSTGHDPEAPDMGVADRVRLLRAYLQKSGLNVEACVPDTVVLDMERGEYEGGADVGGLQAMGVNVLDCRLVSDDSAPNLDGFRLSELLVFLAR